MAQPGSAEVDALLAQARRYEDRGDFAGAVRRYQAAIDLLPEGHPRRDQIQSVVDFIRQTQLQDEQERIREPAENATPRSAIPFWLWATAGLGILLAVCILAAAGYFVLNRQQPPIPRISGLAPTSQVAAPAPTVRISPTRAAPVPAIGAAPTPQPTPLAVPTSAAPAQSSGSTVFQESFSASSLDPARWQVDNRAGTQIQAGGGLLRFSSAALHEPYIHSAVNPFPLAGDFRANLRFRFPDIGTCGTAIAMTSFLLPAGLSQDQTNQLSRSAELAGGVSIWLWHSVIYYRSGSAFEDIAVPGNPMDWRDVNVEYTGNVYRILVNGNPLYTSPPTNARPSVIWMGLPFNLGGSGCAWDSLEVSQIQVQSQP